MKTARQGVKATHIINPSTRNLMSCTHPAAARANPIPNTVHNGHPPEGENRMALTATLPATLNGSSDSIHQPKDRSFPTVSVFAESTVDLEILQRNDLKIPRTLGIAQTRQTDVFVAVAVMLREDLIAALF